MTLVKKAVNHASFMPMQALYDLINTKVQDINSVRASKPTSKEKRWIYAQEPREKDAMYPRIALLNGNIDYEEYGAGTYISTQKDILGNTEKIFYGKVAKLPITISLFVKKMQMHTVTNYNNTTSNLKNGKQADFLGEKIAKYLEMYRSEYFIANNMDIKVTRITRSFDDNDFLIAKNIYCEITMTDEYAYDFTDPSSTVSMINHIDLNIDFDA